MSTGTCSTLTFYCEPLNKLLLCELRHSLSSSPFTLFYCLCWLFIEISTTVNISAFTAETSWLCRPILCVSLSSVCQWKSLNNITHAAFSRQGSAAHESPEFTDRHNHTMQRKAALREKRDCH